MLIDLHLHTNYSDGTLKPHEVVKKAALNNIGIISICDHNTVTAYPELIKSCADHEIKLITGVEVDCFMGSKYIHVLGYGFELNDSKLLALLDDCAKKIEYQNDAVIFNMAKDYSIDLDEYKKYVSPPEIGGYKNSNFLLQKGIIKSIPEYHLLRKKYGVNLNEIGLPDLNFVCETIKFAGGFPVLAHPWQKLDNINFTNDLQTAVDAGIMGFECYYPGHTIKMTKTCVDFCNENNLIITGGSDDHGEFLKEVDGIVYQMGKMKLDVNRIKAWSKHLN